MEDDEAGRLAYQADLLTSRVEPARPSTCGRREDGMPTSAEERHLRRLLALRVAMQHTYCDDGEAQGDESGIWIDFMREPAADIEAKLRALNVARAEVNAAAVKRWNADLSKCDGDGA